MGKKILLADDSITIQKVIELTFSDEDFEVVTVGNGRLAIERVQDVRPDIVLCDIIMPEKDGYEVCDFVKKHPALNHVPVLLLTGAFEPFDQDRAARVGSDGFLAKPFEPQTLIAKVKELLNQAATRRNPAAGAVSVAQEAGRISVPAAAAGAISPAPAPAAAPSPAPFSPPTVPMAPVPQAPPAPAPSPYMAPAAPPAPPVYATPAPLPATPSAPGWPPTPQQDVEIEPEIPSVSGWKVTPAPPPHMAAVQTPPPAAEEVNFISDEPYTETPVEAQTYEPVAEVPSESSLPALDEDLYVPETTAPAAELMDVEPEEAATLQSPPPPAHEAAEPTWAQETTEVSYEDRAQASIAAQSAEPGSGVFEEVFDREPPPRSAEPPIAPDVFSRFDSEFQKAPATPLTPPSMPVPPAPVAPPPAAEQELAADDFESATLEPEPPSLPPFIATPPPAPPVVMAPPPPPPVMVAPPAPTPVVPAAPSAPPVVAELEDEETSFSAVTKSVEPPPPPPSAAAEVAVPVDMVSQIAQRVIAQLSEKVVREVAWEVIPDLAEALIKKEIERLKSELQKI
jgi:CheY-like chemotaxis protein